MDTLTLLQQPHFHLGSHVSQAYDDITQFGLSIGPALELKEKCETLKQSLFSFVHKQREYFCCCCCLFVC